MRSSSSLRELDAKCFCLVLALVLMTASTFIIEKHLASVKDTKYREIGNRIRVRTSNVGEIQGDTCEVGEARREPILKFLAICCSFCGSSFHVNWDLAIFRIIKWIICQLVVFAVACWCKLWYCEQPYGIHAEARIASVERKPLFKLRIGQW